MEIIGYNIQPQQIWDDITNIRPYNGRTRDQFIDGVLRPNLTAIDAIKSHPLQGALNIVNAQNQGSILQALGALPQWQKAKEIAKGTGIAVGWDLETIGDIGHQMGSSYDGYATITEFGIGRRIYKDGILQPAAKTDYVSFAFGVDLKQRDALMDLLTKYKDNGWDALSKSEKVTLDRLSKIGNADGNKIFSHVQVPFISKTFLFYL